MSEIRISSDSRNLTRGFFGRAAEHKMCDKREYVAGSFSCRYSQQNPTLAKIVLFGVLYFR